MHFRALDEEGNALFEGQATVTGTWYKWAKLIDPDSPPNSSYPAYPPNRYDSANPVTFGYKELYEATVAIEILSIEGGYVYFNTGADPGSGTGLRGGDHPYFPTVGTPPFRLEQATMLMPGDILGPASYIRPIQRNSDRAGITCRVIYDDALPLDTSSEFAIPSTAVTNLRVPHGHASILFGKFKITRLNTAAAAINFFYRYRRVDIGAGTWFEDSANKTEWSAEIYAAQLKIAAGGSSNTTSQTVALDAPASGIYEFQVIVKKDSSNEATYESDDNEVEMFQEVWI